MHTTIYAIGGKRIGYPTHSRPVIESLKRVVERPFYITGSHLNMFPALCMAVMPELSHKDQEKVTDKTLGLTRWV